MRPRAKRPALDRFAEKVDFFGDGGCWLWTGFAGRYGTFMTTEQRTVNAHRFAYETLVGPVTPGLQLDHLCRVTRCVNPDHLEVVTPAENTRRAGAVAAATAARMAKAARGCPAGHLWTPDNIYIRPSDGFRECRTCRRLRDSQRRKGKAA